MDNDTLHIGTAVFALDLHPAYSNRAKEGVHLQLQSRLLRWDDELGGVLLAYSKLQRLPSQVNIRPYFAYLEFKVRAEVLVFRPKAGHILCGKVNKLGADYIGMTVFGAINAAVGRQNIKPNLEYDNQAGIWRNPDDPIGDITEGSDVLFAVEKLRIDPGGVLAVMGSLKEPWSGSAVRAAKRFPEAFQEARKWQSADFTFPIVTAPSIKEQPQRQQSAGILEPLSAKKEGKKRKRDADSEPQIQRTQESLPAEKPRIIKNGLIPETFPEQPQKKRKKDKQKLSEAVKNALVEKTQGGVEKERVGNEIVDAETVGNEIDDESARRNHSKGQPLHQNGIQKLPSSPPANSHAGVSANTAPDLSCLNPPELASPQKKKKKKDKTQKVKQKEGGIDSAHLSHAAANGTPDVSIGNEIGSEDLQEVPASKKKKKKKKIKKDGKETVS